MKLSDHRLGRASVYCTLGVPGFIVTARAAAAQGTADQGPPETAIIGILIVGWLIYVIPSIIAFWRKHPNRWLILVVNIVFGATGLGWLGSFVWACSALHLGSNEQETAGTSADLFADQPVSVSQVDPVLKEHSAVSRHADTVERLTQLQALRDSGAIDDEEFAALKLKLLD